MRLENKRKLYFAAPLFNDMERRYNNELANLLERYFDVFLPQRDGGLMVEMIRDGLRPVDAARNVFRMDVTALNECDLLLIILDGRTVDEGAAFELGYMYAHKKPCYGLQTDTRRLLATGNNPMIDCGLLRLFQDVGELVNWARNLCLDEAVLVSPSRRVEGRAAVEQILR